MPLASEASTRGTAEKGVERIADEIANSNRAQTEGIRSPRVALRPEAPVERAHTRNTGTD